MLKPQRAACCKLPLWTAKMRSLITFGSRTFSVLIFAASLGLPKFVVPNFPDLMIKNRTSGDWQSPVTTTLYVKGARQRTETVIEERAQADGFSGATIQQCDERRGFNLNERDKL